MNERKTENIVREKLRKLGYFTGSIVVEEQKSDAPKIYKLLKNASKKGNRAGYPEFIITSKEAPNLLIVIECKADVKKHKSESLDKYADYAVDGALLYASFLAKEFDVIAIGVSGENVKSVRISHHLHLKGEVSGAKFLGHTLLSFEDYKTNYLQDPRKFNQDYQSLLAYSKDLNETLHSNKIKESQRSILISAILIALKNDPFRISYKAYSEAKPLAESLVSTVVNELKNSDIPTKKIDNLTYAYSFIKTHTKLSADRELLASLIEEIDNHINSFMETHQYFDTLGQFYIEFLRYANNDKGLGIVLTPPHITELFIELANINKDSIVLDNCCGTGGFLISAMKKMLADAKGDSSKIKMIKKQQLVGVEEQDDIYALGVSNMIVHGDGKSNIHQGSCFDQVSFVQNKYKPTIGLLNPPYKSKNTDIEELDFIKNNLEMLQQNSKCIAIVPMSCALAQKGSELELKKTLLKEHTLEAVMSMPTDLFHNSKVGVVTCVMVFTTGVPHSLGKKTWFGYWKNDGFEKVKNRGRVDISNKWGTIKTEWVDAYNNRDVEAGKSVMQAVTADDEWCAEAYLETDYGNITEDDFTNEIKKYLAFNILN